MDTKIAQDLIQQLHEVGYRNNLYFHLLGEPLLHPEIHGVLRFASGRTPRAILFTNGSLLTKSNIERVFEARPYELMISMQLVDERTFSLRGSSMSWDQYVSRIRDTIHYKLTHDTPTLLRISVGVRKEDSTYPQDDYFPRVSTSELRSNLGQLFSNVPSIDQEQVREQMGSLKAPFTGRLEMAPGISVSVKQMGNWRRIYTSQRVEKGFCPHFGREFGVLSNGRLVYCHLDYDGKTAFADARHEELRDVFKRPELMKEMEDFLKEGTVPKGCQYCFVPAKTNIREGA